MKKGQIYEGTIARVDFPNKGIISLPDEEREVVVKDGLPGQKVRFMIHKIRRGRAEGRILEVLDQAPDEILSSCPHFGICGGCTYQNLPYEAQIRLKGQQLKTLLDKAVGGSYDWEGVLPSPQTEGYRNKMEFTFGDAYKGGPLSLGMHKKDSFYDIVDVPGCRIVDTDFRQILTAVRDCAADSGLSFYHRTSHEGCLRHLLVREGKKTGEILVDLVTTTDWDQREDDGRAFLQRFTDTLLALDLKGEIVGILHTTNDSVADTIKDEGTEILYGRDFFMEELLGLAFRVTPFSFFQTNTLGAEVLYETVRAYAGEMKDKVIFDLYSGTGTIAQILAPVAAKVVGVEIVEEAVEAAKENAERNGLANCSFHAGDVLTVIDELQEVPDVIILDPPRDGVHPKALRKILAFQVERIVYISCKMTSLVRDLGPIQEAGYRVEKVQGVDLFPGTCHLESVALLSRSRSKEMERWQKLVYREQM